MNWYLVFLGTVTIPVKATKMSAAKQTVIDDYFVDRGIALTSKEVRIRLARPADAAWLRDMGATNVADDLEALRKKVAS